ncbi:MAG: FtsX-like permease family protein, partial [Oscillospiraceae bacterium]|nr:FtsX-like permease family protein [Oscillospiraceae bacterium]
MLKIAFRGLLGKKKDTLLLWSVVALAFVFLVLSTTLIVSLNETDSRQRISSYGSWQIMAANIPDSEAENFKSLGEKSAVLPMIKVKGADYFAGDNEYYFSVISDDLAKLGSFELKEGRWPENGDEIVLEYARLTALGLEIGDTFTVASTIYLPFDEEIIAEQKAKRDEYIELAKNARIERNLEIFRTGTWELYTGIEYTRWDAPLDLRFFAEYVLGEGKDYIWAFRDDENPEGRYIPLEEMTEEEFLKVITYYFDAFGNYGLDIIPFMTEEEKKTWSSYINDLMGYKDMNIRVSQEKSLYSDYDPYIEMANTTDLTVIIPKKYTVCGVMETYSDRWDSGKLDLPCGFVLPESYNDFVNAQKTVIEKYPDFGFVEYGNMALLASEDKEALYENVNNYLDETGPLFHVNNSVVFYWNEQNGETFDSRFLLGFCLLDEFEDKLIPLDSVFVPANIENPEEYAKETLSRQHAEQFYIPTESFSFENSGKRISVPYYGSGLYEDYMMVTLPELSGGTVVVEYEGESYKIPFEDFIENNFSVAGMKVTSSNHIFASGEKEQYDYDELRSNRFAYPSSSEGSGKVLVLVTLILFVTTVCSVFQIFFTQVRKRMRRIILMKSIGAENGQIAKMYFWEFFIFWLSALPIGIIFGLGGALVSTSVLEKFQNREIVFSVDPAVFALSLAAGTLALILGMLIPVIMAVGVPLTGRTAHKKPLAPPKREIRQSFINVTIRGLSANRSKTLGNAALCVFMALIMTLCIFIGFRFMTPYREAVQRDGKPEYLLKSSFAMSNRQLEEYMAQIDELGICDSVSVFRHCGEAIIPLNTAPESILLQTAFPENALSLFVNSGVMGYPVSLYSLNSENELFAKLQSAVTEGKLDAEKFDSGEEVLLLVPLYEETKPQEGSEGLYGWENLPELGIKTSYYPEYRNIYKKDPAIRVGDKLSVGAETRSPKETYYSYEYMQHDYKIGAVIYYFPEEGIWPLGINGEGYQMVCSEKAMTKILFEAYRTRSKDELRALEIMNMASGFGATNFYINAKEDVPREEADTALLIFSRANYMDIEFYHESSQKLLNDAINNILLTCLLGLTAVLIALMIFANTITSDIEQERNKIGILQSLGVSNKQFIKRQLYIGLAVSGAAVLIANVLLWGFIVVYSLLSDAVLGNLLWGYPVILHIAACLLLAAIITVLYIIPMKNIQKYL